MAARLSRIHILPDNPTRRGEAEQTLRTLTGLVAFMNAVQILAQPLLFPRDQLAAAYSWIIPMFLVSASGYVNARRGYRWVPPAIHFLILTCILTLAITAVVYASGTTESPHTAWYVLMIGICTIGISPHAGVVAFGMSSLLYLLVLGVEGIGWVPFAPFYPEKVRIATVPGYTGQMASIVIGIGLATYIGAFFVARTLRRRQEEIEAAKRETDAANARLVALDETKNRFLGVVSHDLRTPITSIKAFGEILEEDIPAEHRPHARTIVAEADRLHRLVTDLLDLDKMEAGKMEWNLITQDIRPVLRNAVSVFSGAARDKNISLTHDISDELPPVRADADRLAQLLANLLSNAIKFTPDGGSVGLAAAVRNGVVISVTDSGPGISAEDIAHLFDRYAQTDTGKKTGGGTGLGLAIAHEIAAAHGGRITVDSVVGQGTTFTATLPRA